MVQFLSINFFSWISSIFVGFFKSSHFFVSLCICHTGLLTVCKQDPDPDPARKLSSNWYNIHHCCVHSEKLLMMDRGTVQNM